MAGGRPMVVKEYKSSSGAKITICDDYLKSKEEQEEIIKRFTLRIQKFLVNKMMAKEETA
jgi:glutathione synthase/RimK-type ligase-like ATP-grasp enzyme